MIYAAGTDKGLLRDINEDSYMIIPGCSETSCPSSLPTGLAGTTAEVASRMAVEYIGTILVLKGCFDSGNMSEGSKRW